MVVLYANYNMYNYELLPKLRHLILVGQNEEGELEWVGTDRQWRLARLEEELMYD